MKKQANHIVIWIGDEDMRCQIAKYLPVVDSMKMDDQQPTAYVCSDFSCKAPATDPSMLEGLLNMTR